MLVQSSREATSEVDYLLNVIFFKKRYLPRRNDLEGEIWLGNHEFCSPYEKFDQY